MLKIKMYELKKSFTKLIAYMHVNDSIVYELHFIQKFYNN